MQRHACKHSTMWDSAVLNRPLAGGSERLRSAFEALGCFAEAAGLDRSLEIAADLNNLAKASQVESGPVQLAPTGNAAAYADYVARLGMKCTEEDAADDIEAAALRRASSCCMLFAAWMHARSLSCS